MAAEICSSRLDLCCRFIHPRAGYEGRHPVTRPLHVRYAPVTRPLRARYAPITSVTYPSQGDIFAADVALLQVSAPTLSVLR